MSAERKYTDRDVRENDNLSERAIEFVEEYQGDFEFLIDCKMRLSQGGELSVGMVRGVLNCMRANPRVKNLPEPLPPSDAEVILMNNPQTFKSKKKKWGTPPCTIDGFHGPHKLEDPEYGHTGNCYGVWEINRAFEIIVKAKVNVLYVAAVSPTSMLHKVAPDWVHTTRWRTHEHEWGFREDYYPDLMVRPLCDKPRGIKNPILLSEWESFMVAEENVLRVHCHRCFI